MNFHVVYYLLILFGLVLMLVGFVGAMCVCFCVFLLFCLHPCSAIYSLFVLLFNTTSDDLMYTFVYDINIRTTLLKLIHQLSVLTCIRDS